MFLFRCVMKICYVYCSTALLFVLTVSLCTPVFLVYTKTHSLCTLLNDNVEWLQVCFRALSKNSTLKVFFIATTTEVNSVATGAKN